MHQMDKSPRVQIKAGRDIINAPNGTITTFSISQEAPKTSWWSRVTRWVLEYLAQLAIAIIAGIFVGYYIHTRGWI